MGVNAGLKERRMQAETGPYLQESSPRRNQTHEYVETRKEENWNRSDHHESKLLVVPPCDVDIDNKVEPVQSPGPTHHQQQDEVDDLELHQVGLLFHVKKLGVFRQHLHSSGDLVSATQGWRKLAWTLGRLLTAVIPAVPSSKIMN